MAGVVLGPDPSGFCMCGCGRKTKIVTKSDRRHGHVMGQPFRFIHGHSEEPQTTATPRPGVRSGSLHEMHPAPNRRLLAWGKLGTVFSSQRQGYLTVPSASAKNGSRAHVRL